VRNNTNKLLVVVVALQGMLLLGQWTGSSLVEARPANAQVNIPDPGARQLQMVEELKGLNAKVDRLTALLQSGEVTVKTVAVEKK
jgi:hypothetical protein